MYYFCGFYRRYEGVESKEACENEEEPVRIRGRVEHRFGEAKFELRGRG